MQTTPAGGSGGRVQPPALPPSNAASASGGRELRAGDRITIPSATPGYEATHTAAPGDTWASVGQRWQVSEKDLRQANAPAQRRDGQSGGDAGQTAPQESEEGIGSFMEGAVAGDFSDNQSWSATAGQVAVGFIPIVGQIADARDTIASVKKVWNGEEGGWLSLGASIVGWVPGIGDAAKAAIRGTGKVADAGAAVGKQALRQGEQLAPAVAKQADEAAHSAKAADQAGDGAKAADNRGAKRLPGETPVDAASRLDRDIAHARANGASPDDVKAWEANRARALGEVRREADKLDGAVPGRLLPNHTYELNGYKYSTDAKGRIATVEGELKLDAAPRSQGAQSRVGKDDGRLDIDQGGHLIGAQFGGYRGVENLTPMNKSVNDYHKGAWGQMEKGWAKALGEGKSVNVKIEIKYADDLSRASQFKVTELVDGKLRTRFIDNPTT